MDLEPAILDILQDGQAWTAHDIAKRILGDKDPHLINGHVVFVAIYRMRNEGRVVQTIQEDPEALFGRRRVYSIPSKEIL
jgi:hypothetical protein